MKTPTYEKVMMFIILLNLACFSLSMKATPPCTLARFYMSSNCTYMSA